LVTLVILPTMYIFYAYSQTSNEEVKQGQLNKVGTDIVDIAEQVYYLGESSKITIDEAMPEGIIGIEIWENQEVVFFLQDGSEIAFKSNVNITTNQHCLGRCHGNFTKRFYSPGLKHIIIEAKADHVFIGETGDNQTDQSEIKEKIIYCDKDNDNYYSTEETYYCPSGRNDTEQGDDCDDSNDLIYPGATEYCNNIDDDCDGIIDSIIKSCNYTGPEGTEGVGECLAGEKTCSAEIWGPCIGEITPVAEICDDNKDNDCDGNIDCDDSECDGDPVCPTCTDNDGDGYGVCPNCGIAAGCTYDGDDCCDSDDDVYPGQGSVFCSKSSCDNWDYNCDRKETKVQNINNIFEDTISCTDTKPTDHGGWVDAPERYCGTSYTYRYCASRGNLECTGLDTSCLYIRCYDTTPVRCGDHHRTSFEADSWQIKDINHCQFCR